MKKYIKSLAALALVVPMLAACSNQDSSSKTTSSSVSKSSSSKKSAVKTSSQQSSEESSSESSSQSSSQSSEKTQSSSSSSDESKQSSNSSKKADSETDSNKMNLAQIKQGDYSSLSGNWELVKAVARHQEMNNASSTLTVNKDSITNGAVTLTADGIKSDNKTQPVKLMTEGKSLMVTLSDDAAEDTATNWSISFYPAGSTNFSVDGEKQNPPTKNTIVIWTSNNNYSEVFQQK